jgi:hypothetical protein
MALEPLSNFAFSSVCYFAHLISICRNKLTSVQIEPYAFVTFVCPCIANISLKYNQQVATLSRYICFYKLLYMFQAVPPPIIRSTKLYIQRQVLSNQYCCLLLSWMRWNWKQFIEINRSRKRCIFLVELQRRALCLDFILSQEPFPTLPPFLWSVFIFIEVFTVQQCYTELP